MRYEKELMDIENKIKELEKFAEEKEVDLSKEIEKQKKLYAAKSKEAYSKLNDWDKVSIARHPERPYAMDYINEITTDFVELHGDRLFGDDSAVVGGLCRIDDKKIYGHRYSKRKNSRRKN